MDANVAATYPVRHTRLGRVSAGFDWALDVACTVCFAVMIVLTLMQVFLRYVFNAGLPWSEEVARWCFVWLVFLGMAVAVRLDSHIAIDMFLRMFPGRLRTGTEYLIESLKVSCCLAMLVHGWDLVQAATHVSASLLVSIKVEYMAVPVGALIALYYLAARNLRIWPSRVAGLGALGLGASLFWVLRELAPVYSALWSPTEVLLGSSIVLLLIGLPVGFAMIFSTFLAFWPEGPLLVLTVTQTMVSTTDSFLLLAIPFFILAGGLMNEGGITLRLVHLADTMVGHIRGGLGHVNILTNTLMAGLSGSSSADAAGICKVLVPAMERSGYDPAFSAGLTASASILANVIPPSIGMLIYGAIGSVSVGALFLAGVIPGLLMALALMLMVFVQSWRFGYGANRRRSTSAEVGRAFLESFWALFMPLIIVVGIRFGVFTPTEAAAVAALYALFAGALVYHGLTPRSVLNTLRQSTQETTSIVFIIATTAPFAYLLVIEQVPQMLAAQLGVLIANPFLLMFAINIFLLLVGLPMEMTPALVILVPILMPIIEQAGIDPVYFGIVMIINLMIGSITPPVGVLVFISASICKLPAHRVFASVVPFEIALILVLLLITYVPEVSLWLPNLVAGH